MIRDMLFFGLWGLVGDRPRIIGKLHDLGVVHLHEEPLEYVSPETAAEMKILRARPWGCSRALAGVNGFRSPGKF